MVVYSRGGVVAPWCTSDGAGTRGGSGSNIKQYWCAPAAVMVKRQWEL